MALTSGHLCCDSRNILVVCLLTVCFGAVVTPESVIGKTGQDVSVRLSGGSTPNAGRVELRLDGNWHAVCDVTGTWDIREAQVVCRQLGFPGASASWTEPAAGVSNSYGGDVARSVLESLECTGNETGVAECHLGVVGGLVCREPDHEARVICNLQRSSDENLSYSVRLDGGRTSREGKVQIFLDDRWLPVCGGGWDVRDARVVCKQLGYKFAKSATTIREKRRAPPQADTDSNRAQFERRLGHVYGWAGLRCTGHEDELRQCGQRQDGCAVDTVAHVVCSDKPSMPAGERLRLRGENEGRVEVYYDGIWWKVCGDGWDMHDASVVCRQLGYPSALAVYTQTDGPPGPGRDAVSCRDGQPQGPGPDSATDGDGDCDMAGYLLSDLQCTGNESSVAECRRGEFGRQICRIGQDAAAVCDGKRVPPTFEARLGAGQPHQPYEGRVELSHGGRWWLVCPTGWDHRDATVLCHQLGFPGVESTGAPPTFKTAVRNGSTEYLLDEVQCEGTERNIAECLHGGVGRARCDGAATAAGVRCATDSLMIQGEGIRLIGGITELEGRVELYHDQRWWTICDDNWDIRAAEVACRQLGLPSAESAVFGSYFGSGRDAMGILLDEVDCKGSEGNLLECSHHVLGQHDCNHQQDAGVRCAPPTVQHQLKLPKPIRLAGGSNASEGRVEIYHKFRWWRVCKSGNETDDLKAALVACRHLEFPSARSVVSADIFEAAPAYARVLLAGLRCQGTERNLSLCRRDGDGDGDADRLGLGLGPDRTCDLGQDLAVRCTEKDPSQTDGPMAAHTRRTRSGPTTPVLAVIIATVFVTGVLIGSLILYHVYKACDRFLSRHPAVISGDAVRSPSATANLDRPELAREARESAARNKDMFIELYPLPPPPQDGDDTETEGGDEQCSDWGGTPIRREQHSGPPPPNSPDVAFDGTLV